MRTAKVLTFLSCREVEWIPQTNPREYLLRAPTIDWYSAGYPATLRMGLYIEFTGADGAYVPRIDVYDDDGELVGCLVEGAPFVSKDPITIHCIALEQTAFELPSPGRYDLVLSFNGEEAARRQLWLRAPSGSA
jgi:hypothetical protein